MHVYVYMCVCNKHILSVVSVIVVVVSGLTAVRWLCVYIELLLFLLMWAFCILFFFILFSLFHSFPVLHSLFIHSHYYFSSFASCLDFIPAD